MAADGWSHLSGDSSLHIRFGQWPPVYADRILRWRRSDNVKSESLKHCNVASLFHCVQPHLAATALFREARKLCDEPAGNPTTT